MNRWCDFRGPRKVAHASSFSEFVASVPLDYLAAVSVTKQRECQFITIGKIISALFPGCTNGMTFSEISPLPARIQLSRQMLEVLTSRQPASRRSTYRHGGSEDYYEQIILPFIDNDFDVRRIAIIADGYSVQRTAP